MGQVQFDRRKGREQIAGGPVARPSIRQQGGYDMQNDVGAEVGQHGGQQATLPIQLAEEDSPDAVEQ
jgi:hypothetical protein